MINQVSAIRYWNFSSKVCALGGHSTTFYKYFVFRHYMELALLKYAYKYIVFWGFCEGLKAYQECFNFSPNLCNEVGF